MLLLGFFSVFVRHKCFSLLQVEYFCLFSFLYLKNLGGGGMTHWPPYFLRLHYVRKISRSFLFKARPFVYENFLESFYQKIEVALFKKDNTIMIYKGQKEIVCLRDHSYITSSHFWDFWTPSPPLRQHVFSTKNKQKLAFSDPPSPPYKC